MFVCQNVWHRFLFFIYWQIKPKNKTRGLKHFPARYASSFYKNLADNVDNFLGSDFYGRITNDAEIPP